MERVSIQMILWMQVCTRGCPRGLEGWIEAQGLRHSPSNHIPIVTLI
jgi:hypothetical protein